MDAVRAGPAYSSDQDDPQILQRVVVKTQARRTPCGVANVWGRRCSARMAAACISAWDWSDWHDGWS